MRTLVKLLFGWMLVVISLCLHAQETDPQPENLFISDDVYIFLHAGPGRNYRILGSIEAGSSVTATQNSETDGFVEIVDAQGRSGWVEGEFLMRTPSMRTRLPQLEEQLADAQAIVSALQQQVRDLEKAASAKQSKNSEMAQALKKAQQTIAQLESAREEDTHDANIRWLLNGGALAAGCVILGVLLTLIPKKHKRNDNWLN